MEGSHLLTHVLHATGSTGNSRASILNAREYKRVEAEFIVEAVGATPTITFAVQGLRPGGDPTVAGDWDNLALGTADSTAAASSATITVSAVGTTRRYIIGLDTRFFEGFAINTTANTNVTYRSNLNAQP